MRKLLKVVLILALAGSSACPTEIELKISKKVLLEGELEDLVTFGLLKEMSCDSDGNIFSPGNRKYSSAINAVVRFTHDAKSYTKFSIDELPHLSKGTIADFVLEPHGELIVLAREVTKYSELEVPVEFGENFLIHYDKDGKILSQLLVKLDVNKFTPTGISVLPGGEFLVVGYRLEEDKTFVIGEKFGFDGALRTRFDLNPEGTRTSNAKTVSSPRVFHPAAIGANGQIYVLRGTTTEPVYVFSATGQFLKTIGLKPAGLEFDSPKIVGNRMLVAKHPAFLEESQGIRIRNGTSRVSLPIFNLESGEIEDEYYWYEETAGLACYANETLTFVGQDESTHPTG